MNMKKMAGFSAWHVICPPAWIAWCLFFVSWRSYHLGLDLYFAFCLAEHFEPMARSNAFDSTRSRNLATSLVSHKLAIASFTMWRCLSAISSVNAGFIFAKSTCVHLYSICVFQLTLSWSFLFGSIRSQSQWVLLNRLCHVIKLSLVWGVDGYVAYYSIGISILRMNYSHIHLQRIQYFIWKLRMHFFPSH